MGFQSNCITNTQRIVCHYCQDDVSEAPLVVRKCGAHLHGAGFWHHLVASLCKLRANYINHSMETASRTVLPISVTNNSMNYINNHSIINSTY